MNEDTARRAANLILGAVALGVTYYVVKNPPLRRMAWRLAVTAVTSTLPAWFSREIRHAWMESGRREL